MNLPGILHIAKKLLVDNSPTILSGVGVAGVIVTTIITTRATIKAVELMKIQPPVTDEVLSARVIRTTRLCWKFYIPVVTTAGLTITSILGAHQIASRRMAALAAAYTLSEKMHGEYREEIENRLGRAKDELIRGGVAQKLVKETPPSSSIIISGNEVLCVDLFTMRYFSSTMEKLKAAQNKINHRILNSGYGTLGDFYREIQLPTTSFSEEVGWSSDELMELEFSTHLTDDNRPCIAIDFQVQPVRNYHHTH
jgi:hypothetical protein